MRQLQLFFQPRVFPGDVSRVSPVTDFWVLSPSLNLDTELHRCKKTFFYGFNVFFIFRTFLKINNVENLLSMQANSEI